MVCVADTVPLELEAENRPRSIAKIRENFLRGIAAAYARCRILSKELDRMVEGPS